MKNLELSTRQVDDAAEAPKKAAEPVREEMADDEAMAPKDMAAPPIEMDMDEDDGS